MKILNERDRRLYAAVEAHKLGYSGVSYIAGLLKISRASIYKGIAELKALAKSSDNDVDDDPTLPPRKRIRRPGAGRPPAKQRDSKLNQAFLDVVALHTAGDPMKEEKQWTDLSVKEISERLRQKGDREVGEHVVTQFTCDGIARWWCWMGRYDYAGADEIMITLDAGGSSGVHCNVFKEKLAALSDKIGMKIRIAHYPPYTSKWHPIEHRLFPHMTRALSGVILKSTEMVRELIEKLIPRQAFGCEPTCSTRSIQKVRNVVISGKSKHPNAFFGIASFLIGIIVSLRHEL